MLENSTSNIKRLFDVRSPMRDGVELSSDVWLPCGEEPFPLILMRTVYLKSAPPLAGPLFEFSKLARFFNQNGYAFAAQDVRGRGDSDGEYGYYFQEGEDGYDTIEWIAKQHWCSGRIGMMGLSYQGAVQWFAAREKPPHLTCIATAASPGEFMNETPYVGGALLQARLAWANIVSGRIFQSGVRDEEWAEIFKHRPLLTADEAMGRKIPLYRQWLEHETLDDYWKPLRLTASDYSTIDIPALHITGWFDSMQSGVLYHWQGMAKYSPAAEHQYLIIGPWDHDQTFFGGALKLGEMTFAADSVVDMMQLHLDFFDHYLKQATDRFDEPRAKVYVTGRNRWRELEAYPVSAASFQKLYLSSQGRANSLHGDGRLIASPVGEEPSDCYVFDPQNPVPLDPFAPGGLYAVDHRPLECRDDVLVYTSDVLEAAVEVIGPVHVELHAASDVRDTDFTASLVDVYPDGRAIVLGARVIGILRARYRNSFEKTEPLVLGQVEKYQIDLGHIAHAFTSGHHIRVEISSSAAPLYNPNQNTGHAIATDTEWRIARQTIHHDAHYPSALVLPVVSEK